MDVALAGWEFRAPDQRLIPCPAVTVRSCGQRGAGTAADAPRDAASSQAGGLSPEREHLASGKRFHLCELGFPYLCRGPLHPRSTAAGKV